MNFRHKKNGAVNGFTLIEALVVLTIISMVLAMSLPSYMEWRQNLEYRQAARDVMSLLRNARSKAIATNTDQEVVVESGNNRAGISTNGVMIWTTFPLSVAVSTGATTTFQFIPNGTVSAGTGTVNIRDSNGSNRFQVLVATTGRISIKKP